MVNILPNPIQIVLAPEFRISKVMAMVFFFHSTVVEKFTVYRHNYKNIKDIEYTGYYND